MVVLTVLQSLAVADTLVLISTLLTQSLRYIGWAAYNNVYGYIFIIFYPLTYSPAQHNRIVWLLTDNMTSQNVSRGSHSTCLVTYL